jgi:hypothetical protein
MSKARCVLTSVINEDTISLSIFVEASRMVTGRWVQPELLQLSRDPQLQGSLKSCFKIYLSFETCNAGMEVTGQPNARGQQPVHT